MKDLYNKIEESANYIKSKINISPSIGLILGSGLGVLADEIENPIKIKYDEIPNFPVSTVQGHAGQLVIGKFLKNISILVFDISILSIIDRISTSSIFIFITNNCCEIILSINFSSTLLSLSHLSFPYFNL